MQNKLVPHPQVAIDKWKGYLSADIPTEERGILALLGAPQPRETCWEEEPPKHLVVKISEDSG